SSSSRTPCASSQSILNWIVSGHPFEPSLIVPGAAGVLQGPGLVPPLGAVHQAGLVEPPVQPAPDVPGKISFEPGSRTPPADRLAARGGNRFKVSVAGVTTGGVR